MGPFYYFGWKFMDKYSVYVMNDVLKITNQGMDFNGKTIYWKETRNDLKTRKVHKATKAEETEGEMCRYVQIYCVRYDKIILYCVKSAKKRLCFL